MSAEELAAMDAKIVADTIAEMQRQIEQLTGARHSMYDPAVAIARDIANRTPPAMSADLKLHEQDRWITHDGGPNPVPGKMVEVCYRNAETETRMANRLGWDHWEAETSGLGGYDIIAYRILPQTEKGS